MFGQNLAPTPFVVGFLRLTYPVMEATRRQIFAGVIENSVHDLSFIRSLVTLKDLQLFVWGPLVPALRGHKSVCHN